MTMLFCCNFERKYEKPNLFMHFKSDQTFTCDKFKNNMYCL